MPSINPKAKGAGYERELAHYLSDALGFKVWRTCVSTKFGDQHQGNHDLDGLPLISVEAKRKERLNFHEAYAQAKKNAATNHMPGVMTRRNRTPTGQSLVVLSLDDFLRLYGALLSVEGITPSPENANERSLQQDHEHPAVCG